MFLPEISKVMGIDFPNPVGLAAGLDKDARAVDGLAALGFGFIEVGTVTPLPQAGNPHPRLFRLSEHGALINRNGFNSVGLNQFLSNLARSRHTVRVGINIGKNAATPLEHAEHDYLTVLRAVYSVADYIAVNISSPNTPGLRDLQGVDALENLLAKLKDEQSRLSDNHGYYTPLAVKISPDIEQMDIDRIADDANPLPHMIPSDEKFAGQVSALGISNHDHIIAYDTTGVGSAARVWWMFHLFGHDRVSVLDGGLPIWQKSGGPVEDQVPVPTTTNFTARLNRDLLRTTEDLLRNVENGAEQVLDARTQGRFTGKEPEPRPGLRSGHIPKSLNLPFLDLYDPKTHLMKSVDQLTEVFSKSGVGEKKRVITSCGSGITACNLALASSGRNHCTPCQTSTQSRPCPRIVGHQWPLPRDHHPELPPRSQTTPA